MTENIIFNIAITIGGFSLGIISYYFYNKNYLNKNNFCRNGKIISDNFVEYNEIPSSYCFTPLDDVIMEYIKDMKINNILEMCAGDGSNAKIMRENGFNVLAYDLKTDKVNNVKYGVCGTLEHLYSDYLLFIASGICSNESIKNYKGKYVLLGGHGNNITISKEKIEIVKNIAKPEVDFIENQSPFDSPSKKRGVRLDMRPSYDFMFKNNYFLKKMWFFTDKDPRKWQKLYVFQLWEKMVKN